MLETAVVVALVGGAYSLFGAVLAAVVNNYRAKLEARRIDHERQQWVLDLHASFEKQLHSIRLEEYPPILAELERLSHFRIESEDRDSIAEFTGKLNAWGYGRSGLVMSGPTRDSLFKLREKLIEFTQGRIEREALLSGPRTDFTEWLRRDMNHSDSSWRQFPSLLKSVVDASKGIEH